MPDRLYGPSGWLPSFDGAPGRLAAVFPTRRQHLFGSEPGVVGVSATTGRYAFLDLPRLADGIDHVALSPDGRRLAYWITGATSGDPRTSDGDPIVGFAVLDAETGRTQQVPLATPHGLVPGQLAWVDDDTLLFGHGQWDGGDHDDPEAQASGHVLPPMTWRPDVGLQELPARADPPWSQSAGGHGWLVQTNAQIWRWVLADLGSGETLRMRQPNLAFDSSGIAVSPDGTLMAGITASGTDQPAVEVIDRTGEVLYSKSARLGAALYWTDDRHLLVQRAVSDEASDVALEVVDLRTRRSTWLVSGLGYAGNMTTQVYAFELLAHPTRPATKPPHPLGTRVVAGTSAAIVLAAGLALLAWRRRARP
jgi:hypothetical protein